MNAVVLLYLATSSGVFKVANGLHKTDAAGGSVAMLVAFCLGNFLMVRVMQGNGLGLAVALSLVFQLLAIAVIAFVVFGERPTGLQVAGDVLGIVSISMIAWPQGAAS